MVLMTVEMRLTSLTPMPAVQVQPFMLLTIYYTATNLHLFQTVGQLSFSVGSSSLSPLIAVAFLFFCFCVAVQNIMACDFSYLG